MLCRLLRFARNDIIQHCLCEEGAKQLTKQSLLPLEQQTDKLNYKGFLRLAFSLKSIIYQLFIFDTF